MDECTAEAFVNRDEPVPQLTVPGSDGTSSDADSKLNRLKGVISGSRLKEKIHDASASRSDSGHSLQDRLFTK